MSLTDPEDHMHVVQPLPLQTPGNMEDIQEIFERQRCATSYDEWLEASEELDSRLGFVNWKNNDKSLLYDYQLIKYRLTELRNARSAGEYAKVLYLIRTTFSRNIGNLISEQLYQNSYCGTKQLIVDYIKECKLAIDDVVNCPDLDSNTVMNALLQTRKAFGRTALVLSGGATLGLLHAGVLFELTEQKMLPKIISGSSAGSIFAALVCTHKDDEFEELWPILDQPLEIFERVGSEESVFVRLKRFLTSGNWIDNGYITDLLQGMLGDVTFQEAYNRTGRILNVTVSSSGMHDMPRLLNYLTAPNVLIWSAVASSCSVPFLFASGNLMAKDPATGGIYSWTKATFIDGSVDNDLPLDRLAEMFNVNHFIACQVNPHIAPMLRLSQHWSSPRAAKAPESLKAGEDDMEFVPDDAHHIPRWFRWSKALVFNEVSHFVDLLDKVGLMKNLTGKLANLMSQEYIGNVTIIPRLELGDFAVLLKNPTPDFMHRALIRGQQAIWPKLAMIHNNFAIELCLDDAVHTLRWRNIGSYNSASTAPKPSAVTRRMSEENLYSRGHRWSTSDVMGSPKQLVRQPSFIQNGKVAGIRHSLSFNAQLNDVLADHSFTYRPGRPRSVRSLQQSPSHTRNGSRNGSGYSSPVGSRPLDTSRGLASSEVMMQIRQSDGGLSYANGSNGSTHELYGSSLSATQFEEAVDESTPEAPPATPLEPSLKSLEQRDKRAGST